MPFIERPETIDEARKNAAFLNVARFKSMFAHRVKKHG
jgi:hypothetical protein